MTGSAHIVVGGTRGIGLGLAKELSKALDSGSVLFVTARQPEQATELEALRKSAGGKVQVVQGDVASTGDAQKLAKTVADSGLKIHTLWINAAIYGGRVPLSKLTAETLASSFATNSIGPHLVIQALAEQLISSPGAKIAIISSAVGSISQAAFFNGVCRKMIANFEPNGQYTASKAALNMLARQWAEELQPHGVVIAAIHPGSVLTDMGTESGSPRDICMTPEACGRGLIDLMAKADVETTAKGMLDFGGDMIPW